jgi:hypothetical protein
MSKRRSKAEWIKICEAHDRSGETAAVFARRRGVRRGTLEWWRWKLGREQARTGDGGRFVEVVNERTEPSPRAVVRIGEVAIEVSDGMPPASWVADLAARC